VSISGEMNTTNRGVHAKRTDHGLGASRSPGIAYAKTRRELAFLHRYFGNDRNGPRRRLGLLACVRRLRAPLAEADSIEIARTGACGVPRAQPPSSRTAGRRAEGVGV